MDQIKIQKAEINKMIPSEPGLYYFDYNNDICVGKVEWFCEKEGELEVWVHWSDYPLSFHDLEDAKWLGKVPDPYELNKFKSYLKEESDIASNRLELFEKPGPRYGTSTSELDWLVSVSRKIETIRVNFYKMFGVEGEK